MLNYISKQSDRKLVTTLSMFLKYQGSKDKKKIIDSKIAKALI